MFYTDKLWFESLDFGATFSGIVWAHVIPALIFSAAMFAVLLVNLVIADRIAPKFRTAGLEDEVIDRYRSVLLPYAGRVRAVVALLFSVLVGFGASSQWREWILFQNRVEWGRKDPQFKRDIGFYVFELPFYKFVLSWMFVVLFVVLAVTAIFHYFNGGIRFQVGFQRVTPQVKAHLSVLLALMAFVKTGQYWFGRYDLVFSKRGAVDGATYTDVHAQIPALQFLSLISIVGGVLFVINIWQRGWRLPVIAAGLWAFISVSIGTAYPAYIQRFTVVPNQRSNEKPYIERNIEATRYAYGIDDEHVVVREYGGDAKLDGNVANDTAARGTLDNVRLWDQNALGGTGGGKIQADEGRKSYYQFGQPSVDRYVVGAKQQAVLVALRELNQDGIPSKTWVNEHLTYTHGTGGVVVEASRTAPQNDPSDPLDPSYLLKGIPPTGEADVDMSKQSDVYFGTGLSGYAIVGTKESEIEAGNNNAETEVHYEGAGGVATSSWLRKAAFAARFGDVNFLASGQLTASSKVLYIRDVQDRVKKAAPFLRFDAEAYPVILPSVGRTVWVIDAYTTSNDFPYSQELRDGEVDRGGGIGAGFNYVRNSVKAVVDAYDGTVTLYAIDSKDPLLKAYRKAFPKMFTDPNKMPEGLGEHFRYPTDLFKVQTRQLERYHETDPDEFFNRSNQWAVTPKPSDEANKTAASTTATTVVKGNDGGRATSIESLGERIPAQYTMMQLPEDDAPSFVLTRSFVPVSKGSVTDNLLSAFIAARSDGYRPDGSGTYGQLVIYKVPADRNVPSPVKAAQAVQRAQQISTDRTLLGKDGSELQFGDVQLLPVGKGVLYAQPVYIRSASGNQSFYTFKYIALTYGDKAATGSTVAQAMKNLFGSSTVVPPDDNNPPPPTNNSDATKRLVAIEREFDAYVDALKAGDFVEAGKRLDALSKLLEVKTPSPQPGGATTTTSGTPSGSTTTTAGGGGSAPTTTTKPPGATTTTPSATSVP